MYNRGEDRSRSFPQKRDFRQGGGGSNSGDNQRGDYRSGQYGGDFHRADYRGGFGDNPIQMLIEEATMIQKEEMRMIEVVPTSAG